MREMTTQEYLLCQIKTLRPIVRHLLEMRRISEDAISARTGDLEHWYKAQRVAFDSSYLTARMHLTTAQELLRRMHGVRSGRTV
jgi:hypothetical protein